MIKEEEGSPTSPAASFTALVAPPKKAVVVKVEEDLRKKYHKEQGDRAYSKKEADEYVYRHLVNYKVGLPITSSPSKLTHI